MPNANHFHGEITVASRIVDYLSSGLYESPAACLKELINNAYDADATRVDLFVKPDADRIIIEDDGHGMTKDEFVKHFSKISESYKRENSDTTDGGRPKIGKIGIGFIAANEICDVMEIYSTTRGSSELLHVNIFFEKMREDPEERRRRGEEFAKGDYSGELLVADVSAHFTQIFLKKVRGEAQEILAGAQATHTSGNRSLYGLTASSVKRELHDSGIKSWAEFDSYSQNMLRVGLNVPVRYYPNWIPNSDRRVFREFEAEVEDLSFSLYMDGTEVLKPTVFSPGDRMTLVSPFSFEGTSVGARGYFYAQHGAIRPQELQGLLVRIRHAAIGEYDPTFLHFSPSEGRLFQNWISGEIWADDRLEDAMNIDRKTLRISHPAFVELQRAVHEHLSALVSRARAELYGVGSKSRKEVRVRTMVETISRVADQQLRDLAPSIATDMKKAWAGAGKGDHLPKAVLKKYDLADIYEIVIEVARDILTPDQLEELMHRLTDRLSK